MFERLTGLTIAPSDPRTWYVAISSGSCLERCFPGCDGVGRFLRSRDGGWTWEHVEGIPLEGHTILRLAVPHDDPLTVFATTMIGPYVTRDGGDSWEPLTLLDDLAGGSPPRPGRVAPSVWVITTDPFDSQLIYAGCTNAAVLRSCDGGHSWEQAASGMEPNESVSDLEPDPSRPGVVYASTNYSGIYVSGDRAQTWERIADGLEIPNVERLALSRDGTVLFAGTWGGGVFRLGPFPDGLDDCIQDLSDACFRNSPDQRKTALHNKLMALSKMIGQGRSRQAMEKLAQDIRAKMDGEGKDDWITCSEEREVLLLRIDQVLGYLGGGP
jgi:photosystem II stability/assembly factor-like uncharacterized protein